MLTVVAIASLLILGVPLIVFVVHTAVLCIASLSPLVRKAPQPAESPKRRFLVLVPAHNEELLIADTVRAINQANYPAGRMHVVVIADNCTDETAAIAREQGARCLERTNDEQRGKPYALNWALKQIDLSTYDALVIVDADTRIHEDFLRRMDAHLSAGQVALQGYFGVLNPDENWLTRLSLLPGTLKFRLHFPGKEVLGLSCTLAGNGMCFDIALIRRFGWNAFSITENWEYWVQLVLNDVIVGSAPDARIYSQVTRSLRSSRPQRQRWMKGRVQTLLSYSKPLMACSFRKRSLPALDALIELSRPSHAMLLMWTLLFTLTALLWSSWAPVFRIAVWTGEALIGAQLVYLLVGLAIEKPPLRTWIALTMVPWYLLWKVFISAQGAFTVRKRAWTRTSRHSS